MGLKVKAKSVGYYGNKIREVGDIFELKDEKHFSKNWMVDLESKEGKKKPSKNSPPSGDQGGADELV